MNPVNPLNPDLKILSDISFISDTKALVSKEREVTAQVLNYLLEIQNRRLYAKYGYSSLFMFCVKQLSYTESQAQRRIEAMRLLGNIPQIEEKIKDGSLSLTAISQAQSYFRQNDIGEEKKIEVLKSLENKSTRECEKTLLSLSPTQPLPREKQRPITATHTQVTLNLPNELLEKLEKIKGLLSHKNRHFMSQENPNLLSHKNAPMTQAELLDQMAEIVLDKIDLGRKTVKKQNPQRRVSIAPKVNSKKIMSQKVNSEKINSQKSNAVKVDSQELNTLKVDSQEVITQRRKYIPLGIKKEIWQKAQSQCTYVSEEGQRCESRNLLQIDHIMPLSMGGSDEATNFRLLCATHNQFEAIRVLGKEKMSAYVRSLERIT